MRGRKMRLRGSSCCPPVSHMWSYQLTRFLDWWNFQFPKCTKDMSMVVGFAYLHFRPIVLLILHAFLLYFQSPGTQFSLTNKIWCCFSVFAFLNLFAFILVWGVSLSMLRIVRLFNKVVNDFLSVRIFLND